MSYGIILIKILEKKYVDDFLDGNLYLNTDKYFTKIDQVDVARHDLYEGADEAWQIKTFSIQNNIGEYVPIGGLQSLIIYRYSEQKKSNLNLLCMYGYSDRVVDQFDERNLEFGCTAIIIKDINEFIHRIKLAANKKGKKVSQGPIEYVNCGYHGKLGPFKKFDKFSYQNEFRFVLEYGNGEPDRLSIGCIRDIVIVRPSSKIALIPKKSA
jgi:hypothetical protein|tara:strand:- start:444 stop:1076 length:633 start_codon:yes stop_codon:yes gene_type:complete